MSNAKKNLKEKHKWTDVQEKVLRNIILHADNGALRKVLLENKTNVKMTKFNAWECVK